MAANLHRLFYCLLDATTQCSNKSTLILMELKGITEMAYNLSSHMYTDYVTSV